MKQLLLCLLLTGFMLGGLGCVEETQPGWEASRLQGEEVFAATVGNYCELIDYQSVQVRAYAIVWGLPGTGSAECPPHAREELLNYLRRIRGEGLLPRYAGFTADQILASRTTAVVMVSGYVPAGAPENESFDVEISALPATQTTSLQGGYLLPTDLRIVGPGASGRVVASRPHAVAEGPIFVNPFPRPDGSVSDTRRGVILGGGRSIRPRSIRLAIIEPDLRNARLIENSLNTRFPQEVNEQTATATRSDVVLRVPQEFRDEYSHFVALALAVYVRSQGGYQDTILRDLDAQLANGDIDYVRAALAWEAIGRNAQPFLRRYYADPESELAFYAAAAAARIGDMQAIDTLIAIAENPNHPQQLLAARDLGRYANDPSARRALIRLLSDSNVRLRMLAYEALRKVGDGNVRSENLLSGFSLDIVRCAEGAEQFVGIWAVSGPRIVLFGGDIVCPSNVFYMSQDGRLTINAASDSEEFSITRQLGDAGQMVQARSALTVADLVRVMARPLATRQSDGQTGLAMTFSEIVGALHGLHEDGVIPGGFQLHRVEGDLTR
ncbi:MAG: flagellar basal body P-ring protein FlgI [Sedimentisphaerales bacterium]|nr:flagellar basal body P-ring protein FlgI [Sedimentisphaerales bacterium]